MENILKSASKITLLAVSGAICVAYIYVVVTGKVEGNIIAKTFDMFLALVAGAYFGRQLKKSE